MEVALEVVGIALVEVVDKLKAHAAHLETSSLHPSVVIANGACGKEQRRYRHVTTMFLVDVRIVVQWNGDSEAQNLNGQQALCEP